MAADPDRRTGEGRKSWAAAQFTACDKIGQAYWLDLGEGAADEYIAIPGAKYDVIDHDGTWFDIVAQVREVAAVAATSEKPVVLIIDSMTAEWDMIKDWISVRAKESKMAKRKLAEDPNAEIKPSMNLWNDAASRHYELMRMLMKFPGIVIDDGARQGNGGAGCRRAPDREGKGLPRRGPQKPAVRCVGVGSVVA